MQATHITKPSENAIRLDWVDVLKFLGILAIYLGHFYPGDGRLHPVVFAYHVPLFFFVSGFFAISSKNEKEPFFVFVKRKAISILVPYSLFCALAICIEMLVVKTHGPLELRVLLTQCIMGNRNEILVSGSLWFLPSIFLITIVFEALHRLFRKNIILIIAISAVGCFAWEFFIPLPKGIFSYDTVLQYSLYYVLGAVIFPWLQHIMDDSQKKSWDILLFYGLALVGLIYLLLVFFNKPLTLMQGRYIAKNVFMAFIFQTGAIFSNIVLCKVLRKVTVFQKLGRSTLIFCGTEQFFKRVFELGLGIFGISFVIESEVQAILAAFVCLYVSNIVMVPLINTVLQTLTKQKKQNLPSAIDVALKP